MRELLTLGVLGLLVGCTTVAPTPNSTVCPVPAAYSPAFEKRAAGELADLPAVSALRTLIDDYGRERAELRACAK